MSRTEIHSPVARYLQELLAKLATLDDGEVATYIPELGTVDANLFGIARHDRRVVFRGGR